VTHPGARNDATTPPARRLLLVVSTSVEPSALRRELFERGDGRPDEIMVVCPATTSLLKLASGQVDEAIEQAGERLDRIVAELGGQGAQVQGEVGDSDPKTAVQDALVKFHADEIIFITSPGDDSGRLEKETLESARQELAQPITHVVVEHDGGAISDVERSSAHPERAPGRGEGPYGIPRMPAHNLAATIIGIVGTVVLGILAGGCFDDISHEDMDGGCALRIGLAIAALIVTVFHVSALLFFRAVRYRGTWERIASWTLIVGIPLAIIASAIAS
jgi:hypothetical protein